MFTCLPISRIFPYLTAFVLWPAVASAQVSQPATTYTPIQKAAPTSSQKPAPSVAEPTNLYHQAVAQGSPDSNDEVDEDESEVPTGRGIARDPNLDRSFLFPTATTQPKGSLTYTNYEVLFHGITYGLTDRIQGSLTLLPPYMDDMPFVGSFSLKGQILRSERVQLALQGSVTYGSYDLDDYEVNESDVAVGLGGFASVCLSKDCGSLLSFSATSLFNNGSDDSPLLLLGYSASLTQRLGSNTKLLVEIASAVFRNHYDGFENVDGILVNYGVRIHGRDFAADIGFMRPMGEDVNDDFVLGFPFISFSYRRS